MQYKIFKSRYTAAVLNVINLFKLGATHVLGCALTGIQFYTNIVLLRDSLS